MTIFHGNAYVTRLGRIKYNPKIQDVLNPKEENARVQEVFRHLNDVHSVVFSSKIQGASLEPKLNPELNQIHNHAVRRQHTRRRKFV